MNHSRYFLRKLVRVPVLTSIILCTMVSICFISLSQMRIWRNGLASRKTNPHHQSRTKFGTKFCIALMNNSETKSHLAHADNTGIQSENFLMKQKLYANNGKARRQALAAQDKTLTKLVAMIQADCPGVIRMGNVGKGGKFLCAPWMLRPNCVIYSIGLSANDAVFNDHLMKSYGKKINCKFHAFDPDYRKNSYENITNIAIQKLRISSVSMGRERSLRDAMKELGHDYIDLLQMDIQHEEYAALEPMLLNVTSSTSFACQIILTIYHEDYGDYERLMKWMEFVGYNIISKQLIPGCENCFQLGYIHDACRKWYGVSARYLSNFQ